METDFCKKCNKGVCVKEIQDIDSTEAVSSPYQSAVCKKNNVRVVICCDKITHEWYWYSFIVFKCHPTTRLKFLVSIYNIAKTFQHRTPASLNVPQLHTLACTQRDVLSPPAARVNFEHIHFPHWRGVRWALVFAI